MKQLLLVLMIVFVSSSLFAQAKEETIKVSGNCGTCKKKIEKAATAAGATFASWDKTTKVLAVKYDASKTSDKKIEESIAAAGYDTEDVKASDEAYKKLDECCQYDRKTAKKQ